MFLLHQVLSFTVCILTTPGLMMGSILCSTSGNEHGNLQNACTSAGKLKIMIFILVFDFLSRMTGGGEEEKEILAKCKIITCLYKT